MEQEIGVVELERGGDGNGGEGKLVRQIEL